MSLLKIGVGLCQNVVRLCRRTKFFLALLVVGTLWFAIKERQAPEVAKMLPQTHFWSASNNTKRTITRDKVFWSEEVEKLVPTGLSEGDFEQFKKVAAGQPVTRVFLETNVKRSKCGLRRNQFARLEGGTEVCVRYRIKPYYHDNAEDGRVNDEVLVYHLSRYLGLDQVAPIVLAQINKTRGQWRAVRDNATLARWQDGRMVALIKWIPGCTGQSPANKMPALIMDGYQSGEPLTAATPGLANRSDTELSLLAQYSDMILFDFITQNTDRMVHKQVEEQRYRNTSYLYQNLHNLCSTPQGGGKVWLFDNESTFIMAYWLNDKENYARHRWSRRTLRSICLFREETVRRIKQLSMLKDPALFLDHYAKQVDPLYGKLVKPHFYHFFRDVFPKILRETVKWVETCKRRV